MRKNILRQRELPDYYPTMYLDGYMPEEILQARKNSMYKELLEYDDENITINVEVKQK